LATPRVPPFPAGLDVPDDGLLGHVVHLNLLVNQALEEAAAPAGISAGDYLVLGVVRRSVGQRSAPTAICEVLGRTTGGMSLTLDRLEAAGWLKRLPDPTDRRRVVVEATSAGLAVAAEVNSRLHEWEDELGLTSATRRGAVAAIERLAGAIQASTSMPV
jgi:DNA-binding MarR family transcriptional regulator